MISVQFVMHKWVITVCQHNIVNNKQTRRKVKKNFEIDDVVSVLFHYTALLFKSYHHKSGLVRDYLKCMRVDNGMLVQLNNFTHRLSALMTVIIITITTFICVEALWIVTFRIFQCNIWTCLVFLNIDWFV